MRDFNVSAFDPGVSATLTTNNNTPDRLINGSSGTDPDHNNALNGETITHYRLDLSVDENNEVVPGSEVGVFYSTDGGTTWTDFYAASELSDTDASLHYDPYTVQADGGINGDNVDNVDNAHEWIAISATRASDGDSTGFMLSKDVLTAGEDFITADPSNAVSEFTVCFTTGMRIETANGPIAVEDLKLGDMVLTLDHGFQPVRIIYRRKTRALGAMRPVVFEQGALGSNARFVVSQKHRIHMSMLHELNPRNANNDALMEAIQLVNGSTIRVTDEFKTVEYFHIMFDNHELVWSEGVLSESWQPHRRNLRRDKELRKELLAIFPELAERNGPVNGKPARPTMAFRR